MNIIRCKNNKHWYDADSYATCPHCETEGLAETDSVKNREHGKQEKRLSWPDFAKKGRRRPETRTVEPADPDGREREVAVNQLDDHRLNQNIPPYTPYNSNRETYKANKNDDFMPTEGAYNSLDRSPDLRQDIHKEEAQVSTCTYVEENESEPTSLMKEVNRISKVDMNKTVGFFKGMTNRSAGTGANASSVQNPVVGWLVCVEGPHWGESFSIVAGKNSIGRGAENQVVLSKDPSVSGKAHAWITYEERHRNFLMDHGDGRYPDLNGEQVLSPVLIKSFDEIQLGETTLLFVSLCGDKFSWDEHMKED